MSQIRDEVDNAAEAATALLPTRFGAFRIMVFPRTVFADEHVALIRGDVEGGDAVPVRLHSECLTGDVLGSRRCDCRAQLEASLAMIQEADRGILLYMRQEGRGIGLYNKIRAYRLQEQGRDTVEANIELGFEDDHRNYAEAAKLLELLGPRSILLITNNMLKVDGLRREGIVVVDRVPLLTEPDEHNEQYLRTKAEKLGHLLEHGPGKR